MPSKVCIVCTSASKLASTKEGDEPMDTGLWIEEAAAPYYLFKEAGHEVVFASPAGGEIPIDEASKAEGFYTDPAKKLLETDVEGKKLLDSSMKLEEFKKICSDYQCLFLAGGHGTLTDFVNNPTLTEIVETMNNKGAVIAGVCHGVVGFVDAKSGADSILKGKKCAGFSNTEEEQVQKMDKVAYTPEQKMKELGGEYSCGDPWSVHVQVDGKLVTGQNPQSSAKCAEEAIKLLGA